MQEDTTEHSTAGHLPLVVAMDGLRSALRAFARAPWSSRRQLLLLTAIYTILEVHASHAAGLARQAIAGPIETIKRQQGRHAEQLARLDKRVTALEGGKAREVGE